jgi:hypothetical protein
MIVKTSIEGCRHTEELSFDATAPNRNFLAFACHWPSDADLGRSACRSNSSSNHDVYGHIVYGITVLLFCNTDHGYLKYLQHLQFE